VLRAILRRPLVLALLCCLVAGCSKSSTESKGGSAAMPGMALVITINKLEGGEELTQGVETIEEPTLAQLEEKFNAVGWGDAQLKPHVGLGRSEGGVTRLSIGRPQDTQGSTSMQADWMAREGGAVVYRRSEVITSKDKALALLKAFYSKDASLSSLANWTTIQE
jgi:hypothetical protein